MKLLSKITVSIIGGISLITPFSSNKTAVNNVLALSKSKFSSNQTYNNGFMIATELSNNSFHKLLSEGDFYYYKNNTCNYLVLAVENQEITALKIILNPQNYDFGTIKTLYNEKYVGELLININNELKKIFFIPNDDDVETLFYRPKSSQTLKFHIVGSSTINWQSIVGLKVYDAQDDIVASGTMTARSQNEISVKLSSVNNIYKFVFTFENTLPAGLAHIIQLHYGS